MEETRLEKTPYPQKQDIAAYLIDLTALVRARTNATFDELVVHILDLIPTGYKRVDIIADTYRTDSIKEPERIGRGCAEKVLVRSSSSHLPRNFEEFLKNGDNKSRMIEIFKEVLVNWREEVLIKLQCETLFHGRHLFRIY